MSSPLARHLRREQRAFLARDRAAWAAHLARIRAFLGEGLASSRPGEPAGGPPRPGQTLQPGLAWVRRGEHEGDAERPEGAGGPPRPALILGAGSGLEVPWASAPRGTTGWDADPWSRLRTALRHRRWAPWVFEDLTGGFRDLEALATRCVRVGFSGARRDPEAAAARLAGLLPTLSPDPAALRSWIARHRPRAILAANAMGQFGAIAEALVAAAFAPHVPWEEDPDRPDPLAEALDAWTARALRAFLACLRESGAALWLVHDRGVLHGPGEPPLGPLAEPWTAQIRDPDAWEVSDPLCGVDVRAELAVARLDRWLWPVGPGQTHLMEAVVCRGRPAQA